MPADSEAPDAPVSARLPRHFEWIVATLIVVLGGLFVFAVPALGGYDEGLHFLRAWQVSDGGVFARVRTIDGQRQAGGDESKAMYADLESIVRDGVFRPGHAGDAFDHLDDPAPTGETSFVGFNGSAVYSPVPYLPAAIAIRVGRVIGLSTFAMILLARLAQLLVYAALVALAIRRIPQRRLVLAISTLAPVALVQAGTINADAMTTALVLLVIAEAFHLRAPTADEIRWPQLAEPAVALGALALAKQPYVLVAAFFLVPMWHHRGRIAAWLGTELGIAAVLTAWWSHWAQSNFVAPIGSGAFGGDKHSIYAYVDVDPNKQLAFVRGHPFSFLAAIGRTIGDTPTTLPRDIFTQAPGWRAGVIIVLLTIAMLVVTLLLDALPVPGGILAHLLGVAVAGVLTLAVFATAYLGWNAVGTPRVDAFQGRYLFPVVATILIVAIPNVRTRFANLRYAPVVLGVAAALSLSVTYGLAHHYY